MYRKGKGTLGKYFLLQLCESLIIRRTVLVNILQIKQLQYKYSKAYKVIFQLAFLVSDIVFLSLQKIKYSIQFSFLRFSYVSYVVQNSEERQDSINYNQKRLVIYFYIWKKAFLEENIFRFYHFAKTSQNQSEKIFQNVIQRFLDLVRWQMQE